MRPIVLFIVSALVPCLAAAMPGGERDESIAKRLGARWAEVRWRADGRVGEIEAEGVFLGIAPTQAAEAALTLLGDALRDPADGTVVKVESVRESLTGRHVRLRQYLGDTPVFDGELVVRLDRSGRLISLANALGIRKSRPAALSGRTEESAAVAERAVLDRERAAIVVDGLVLEAMRLIVADPPYGESSIFVDRVTGEVLRTVPHYWTATTGRVFESNPVTRLNDPSLRDRNDSVLAVPESAYSIVELHDLIDGSRLTGPILQVVDLENPKTDPAGSAGSFHADRSIAGFEEVMAYHHLDGSLRHLRALGYEGSRAIFTRRLQVDAHAANGADQSFYRWTVGGGALLFGDGGVDDAEDPDIVQHEFGHALQDAIAPFAFAGAFGSESRASGEGFGDYWAFSAGLAASLESGRDPYCIGDWDARCWGTESDGCGYEEGSDCLRRVDSTKTMADFIRSEQSGVEHRNGEIWASALREILLAIAAREGVEQGRITSDRMVVESHFGVPPSPGFRTMGRRMIEADRLLTGGMNRSIVCAAMLSRQIFSPGDCDMTPRGEFTAFQGLDFGAAIPDGSSTGIRSVRHVESDRRVADVRVGVHIVHPFRGDLRIHLIAPSGRITILQAPSGDSGADIDTTYGLDSDPREPLTDLEGIVARGDWTLHVIDTRARDVGTLVSWNLEIRFEGDEPLTIRPHSPSTSLHLPGVAHTAGVNGTFFVSDVRLLNYGESDAELFLLYTAAGTDGSSGFAARRVDLSPGQQVALDDVVGSEFRQSGVGSIELSGELDNVLVTSRTYNATPEGSFGQFVPGSSDHDAIGTADEPVHVIQMRNDAEFRSNLGFSETAGQTAVVAWTVFDADGRAIEEGSTTLAPWSQSQVPLLGGVGGIAEATARVEARVVSGGGKILAYGSVIDNRTGDATFVPASPAWSMPAAHVAAVIRSPGAAGTFWRSDLTLVNLGVAGVARLVWIGADGTTRSADLSVGAGASARIEDLLGTLWGAEGGGGTLRIETNLGRWLASGRAWTPGGEGSYGQFIPALAPEEASTVRDGARWIPHLAHADEFRTNIGVAELSGRPAVARIRLFDGGGSEIWSALVPLEGGQQKQVSLALSGAPAVANGYASIEVVEGEGTIASYGSVVDNRTGDPIYVPAR